MTGFAPVASSPVSSFGESSPAVEDVLLFSVSPSEVEDHGGQVLTLAGRFALGDIFVSIVVNGIERLCYSGRSGFGNAGQRTTGAVLKVIAPPLPKGGPFDIIARQGSSEDTLVGVLTARNRYFRSRVSALRALMPPYLKSGPRSLDFTDPLNPEALVADVVPNLVAVLQEAMTPVQLTSNNPRSLQRRWSSIGTALPAWLALDALEGVLSGTPVLAGQVTTTAGLQLRVTDGGDVGDTNVFSATVTAFDLFLPPTDSFLETFEFSGLNDWDDTYDVTHLPPVDFSVPTDAFFEAFDAATDWNNP